MLAIIKTDITASFIIRGCTRMLLQGLAIKARIEKLDQYRRDLGSKVKGFCTSRAVFPHFGGHLLYIMHVEKGT